MLRDVRRVVDSWISRVFTSCVITLSINVVLWTILAITAVNSLALADVDWRTKGVTPPIVTQNIDSSVVNIVVVEAIESAQAIASGKFVALSLQQLRDCITDDFVDFTDVFDYILQAGGLDTAESYPPASGQQQCKFNTSTIGAKLKGYRNVTSGNEDQLAQFVAQYGPVATYINAEDPDFAAYSGGIFDNPQCNSDVLDHAVLVVGYGVTTDGIPYWILQNSWGPNWGEGGYMRIKRNGNLCGVASIAAVPLV